MVDLFDKIRSLVAEAEHLGSWPLDESWEFFTAMELSEGHGIPIEEVEKQIEEFWGFMSSMDPAYEELVRGG
jgi:hypothetical protein